MQLIKTEKTIKVIEKDEEGHFNISILLYCYRCGDYKCLHVVELIEKLLIK